MDFGPFFVGKIQILFFLIKCTNFDKILKGKDKILNNLSTRIYNNIKVEKRK